jgi:hypothetical protein
MLNIPDDLMDLTHPVDEASFAQVFRQSVVDFLLHRLKAFSQVSQLLQPKLVRLGLSSHEGLLNLL